MYRIRTAEGNETVYDSLEAFSAAVKRGAVTPDDEIFHTRAGRWLDIKSHPHYRSALTLNGGSAPAGVGTMAAETGPRPAAPAQAAAPASAPKPVTAERPSAPQTVYRNQISNSQPKTKELTFIDIDGSIVPPEKSATIVPVRKPTPRPVPRTTPPASPAAPPAPAVKPKPDQQPAAGSDFLVMDGGIESPVRTSSGHRTVGDDLDVLFDAPLPPVPPPAAPPKAAGTQVAMGPLKAPAPAPKPAAPVPAPAAAPVSKKEVKPATAPVVGATTPVTTVPAVTVAAVPAAAAPKPAPAPAATAEDLDIPGGPLVESEPAGPIAAPMVAAHRPTRVLIAAGIAAVLVTGALLLWGPWQSGSATNDVAAQTGPAGLDSSTAGAMAAPATPGPADAAAATAVPRPAIKPVAAIGPAPASGAETLVDEPKEEIVAAVRPNFRADAVISTADMGLGSAVSGPATVAIAPSELARRAEAAERAVQQDLGVKLGSAGFRSLLAPTRIGSAEGAASARNAWIAGADAIRQYRARIGRVHKAYEDSMLMSQRAERWPVQEMRAWGARQSLAEPGDVTQLADLMFSQITEALDLLAALGGQYEIKSGAIHFRSPGAETRYTAIRNWVEQRMHTWAATPATARPHSVNMILQALGDGLPPVK
jgi:hypothetical protein